jgi:hypothetical protein
MTDPLPIVATLRTVADVIEDAMRVGVPEPQTVSVTWHTGPTIILGEFADVEEWALYLEAKTETRTSGGGRVEHLTVNADLADPYGIAVKVTTNRKVPDAEWDAPRDFAIDGLKP